MKGSKPETYEVTLRRDVQQMALVHVEASTPQEAIEVAEAVVDTNAWRLEEHIGTHRPKVRRR